MIGFIYMIVVIELEITIAISKNSIISLTLIADIIVFNLGMNPNSGGIPIMENIEISIALE